MLLVEQYNLIERMMSNCMLNHVASQLRQWIGRIEQPDEREQYYLRLNSLLRAYARACDDYKLLPSDAEPVEMSKAMDYIAPAFYELFDELYVRMRILEGLAPTMHGFNAENPTSVVTYFSACPQLTDEDLNWFEDYIADPEHKLVGIMLTAAIGHNLTNSFNLNAIRALINASQDSEPLIADQALVHLILVLAHYDMRIDYFEDLQNEVLELIGDGRQAFEDLVGMIYAVSDKHKQLNLEDDDDIPEPLRDALQNGENQSVEEFKRHLPDDANPYMLEMVRYLPESWIFSIIISTDERREKMAELYIRIGMQDIAYDAVLLGRLDLCTNDFLHAGMLLHQELYDEALDAYVALEDSLGIDDDSLAADRRLVQFRIGWCAMLVGDYELAEAYMVCGLRGPKPSIEDYINYAHLCLIRGDKLSAYEYYLQARKMAGSLRRFKKSYCADRKMLIEHGVPMEVVYLIEDMMVNPQ